MSPRPSGEAEKIAKEREILPWPDSELWPGGPPKTPGAAFATVTSDYDEKKVGVLGLERRRLGVIPLR